MTTSQPETKEERAARAQRARAIRPVKVSVTETSVKEAIYEADKRRDKTTITNRTAMDIAELVAAHKASDFSEWYRFQNTQYVSRASLVRKWVSVNSVRTYIADLVNKGWLVAVPGSSPLFTSRYGIQKNATYYFRKEAYDALVSLAKARSAEKDRAKAEKRATEILLDNHAEEHRAIVEAILEGKDPFTATW